MQVVCSIEIVNKFFYNLIRLKKNPLFPVTWVQKTRQGGDKFIFIFYFDMEKLHNAVHYEHFNIIMLMFEKIKNHFIAQVIYKYKTIDQI